MEQKKPEQTPIQKELSALADKRVHDLSFLRDIKHRAQRVELNTKFEADSQAIHAKYRKMGAEKAESDGVKSEEKAKSDAKKADDKEALRLGKFEEKKPEEKKKKKS